MYDQTWLTENVGPPSNAWGSTYSEIYRLTGQYEERPDIVILERLIELVNKFTWSLHAGAKTQAQQITKMTQAKALNEFCAEVKRERVKFMPNPSSYQPKVLVHMIAKGDKDYLFEKFLVKSAIEEMQRSRTPLLRNTGIGLNGMNIGFNVNDPTLGEIRNNKISVNPIIAHNKLELMGVLVHEYHHFLCRHNGENDTLYVDEFVAHYKQFSITLPMMNAELWTRTVNEKLEKNYRDLCDRWKMHHNLLENIDQAGGFQVEDNADRVDHPKHAAVPSGPMGGQ